MTHITRQGSGFTRIVGVLLTVAFLLAACSGNDDIEPPNRADATPTDSAEPDREQLDGDTAAALYTAWRERVYALPPTQPDSLDVEAAGNGVAVPASEAATWVTQELQLARDRGVIVRGSVHAEATSAIQVVGARATTTICSSADLHITDVATGDPVSDEPIDTSYTRFDVAYRRTDDGWLVEKADQHDERNCVPPSIEQAVTARWELFTEAWYERDRQGGGPDIGELADVVTDRFAETLRGLPPRELDSDPDPFTDFGVSTATPTTAIGHACRYGSLQTVEWMLADGQWQVDFAGRVGQEPTPCP